MNNYPDFSQIEKNYGQAGVSQHDQELTMSETVPVLMRKVYTWMALALVITGFTAYYVATSPAVLQFIFTNQIVFWGLIIGEFALVLGLSAAINRLSLTTATLMFVLYSVINGATLSSIFMVYTMSSITSVFFITAGTFATMAAFGYFTKTDLSSLGKILLMALIGIIIATIVNIFMKSSGLELILNYLGVLVFVGLTAYDSQKIKEMMLAAPDAGETAQKLALLGALSLYLDFINLFLYLLRIFGRRD
ncbi:MAG: Bax inhibitor-1/YccA family protein [Prevotella sp.]|nr:Bax inhibitor-1/YccA family protein [Prevotella sp.]